MGGDGTVLLRLRRNGVRKTNDASRAIAAFRCLGGFPHEFQRKKASALRNFSKLQHLPKSRADNGRYPEVWLQMDRPHR